MGRTPGIFDGLNLADIGGVVHFNPEEYDDAIETHGTSCEYRRSILCPCIQLDTQAPRLGCKHCRGLGYLYPEELRQPLIVLDVSRSGNLKLVQAGLMASGQISLTFPRGFLPGRGDQILMDGDLHLVQEQLWQGGSRRLSRGHLSDQRPPDSIPLVQRPRAERLLYECEVQIEAVYYLADDELHQASCSEYVLLDGNVWRWQPGRGPAEGEAWTVRYRAPSCYFVENSAPVYRDEADRPCPYRVEAKRLDRIAERDLR